MIFYEIIFSSPKLNFLFIITIIINSILNLGCVRFLLRTKTELIYLDINNNKKHMFHPKNRNDLLITNFKIILYLHNENFKILFSYFLGYSVFFNRISSHSTNYSTPDKR